MWVSHVMDQYTTVLILQLLCMLPEHIVHVQAKDTCQVGQEKNQKGQWRWVLPYEYPCECGKVVYGGMNTVTPKRPFKPVYVKVPMVGDNVGDIRDHYGMNCSEIRCPPHRLGRAQQGRTTRRFPNETVTAVDNHGAALNVSCNPPLNSNFSIGQTNVNCFTQDQRGINKSCAFEVIVADFNECERKRHNCATNALCVNTDGSYNCSCTKGYEGDGSECVDIDECMTQSHNCSANAACHNTDGSYNCSCNQGYGGDGFECVDIDECTTQSHNCSANAACNNTDGSYNCSCNQGYVGDGFECVDIDECLTSNHSCSVNAACTNTDGSYNCSCNEGYGSDGFECVDVDECTTQSHDCSGDALCTNTNGSYNCSCYEGYEGDGLVCVDINECTNMTNGTNDLCVEHSRCFNNAGSFTCRCDPGYRRNGIICEVASCPLFDDYNRYCFVHHPEKKFRQAQQQCQNMGAKLASIHSQHHQDTLKGIVTNQENEGGNQWWGYWIGFNDIETENEFEWTDGTPMEECEYTNWGDGDPNDYQNNQDCVVMAAKKEAKWYDENCNNKYPYICKKISSQTSTTCINDHSDD